MRSGSRTAASEGRSRQTSTTNATARSDAFVVSGQLLDSLVVRDDDDAGRNAEENAPSMTPPPPGTDKAGDVLELTINGEKVSVAGFASGPDTARMSLAEFLRSRGLTGTKVSCAEGGCGACTVLMKADAAATEWLPINACLRLVGSCHGATIVTAEGIGGHGRELDPMQSGLADGCGSQCGFCSPGMVASGVALRTKLRAMQRAGVGVGDVRAHVEQSLDGNICRCTGYLPIVDSITKIIEADLEGCAAHANRHGGCAGLCDLEDLCASNHDHGRCTRKTPAGANRRLRAAGAWEAPTTLDELTSIMRAHQANGIRIVAGNTGIGVAKYYQDAAEAVPKAADESSLIVDISHVEELSELSLSRADDKGMRGLRIGSTVTIAHFLEFLASESREGAAGSGALTSLHEYVSHVANTQVRSVGTIGGNVIIAATHAGFPSDIALALMAMGATATVVDPSSKQTKDVSIGALMSRGIEQNLLLGFSVSIDDSSTLMAMRVSKRRVNAHAVVNAGVGLRLAPNASDGSRTIVASTPIIAFGGISRSGYVRATSAEILLSGKDITQSGVLHDAMLALSNDLVGVDGGASANSSAVNVAMGLFYRAFLRALPSPQLPLDLRTAAFPPEKPPVSGTVSYDGNPKTYPVSKGMVKLSAAMQTSGEAMYTNDFIPSEAPNCVYVAHVLATHGNARIASIDGGAAMALDDSVLIIDAVTLGEKGVINSFSADEPYLLTAGDRVSYNGQVIALVIASSKRMASAAAKMVKVEYTDIREPILGIDDAIAAKSFYPAGPDARLTKGDAAKARMNADLCVEGVAECGHQYHFYMETQTALAFPGERGSLRIRASTQSPTSVQSSVSKALGLASNKVTVEMKRGGGGYGGKGERSIPPAVHAAIACHLTGRPSSVSMDINTNMLAVGSRRPHKAYYRAAVKGGMITGLEVEVYNLQGAFTDMGDVPSLIVSVSIDGVYSIPNWEVNGLCCKSNTAANTSCRGPSWLPGTYIIESIFDSVAARLGESPEDFKRRHFYKEGQITPSGQRLDYFTLPKIWDLVLASSMFARRQSEIDTFNCGSRFVKRGIAATPMKYGIGWSGNKYTSIISVYDDGTVLLSHAGCEIGQGIDVKCAQVAAYLLGCPIEMIEVSRVSTLTAANCSGTGGSHTSENNSQAVKNACDILNKRLSEIDRTNKSWTDVIAEASDKGIDLQARGHFAGGDSPEGPFQYCSFGCGVSEVQVDLLTGEAIVLQTDLLLDCGVSLNPTVDLGQAQGGFIMGLGYMLTEEFEFAPVIGATTGKLTTDGTWEYKPPSCADGPSVLNVSLLKNAPNPLGFMQSKASGEPPLLMSIGVLSAIRNAVSAYSTGMDYQVACPEVQAPATPLRVMAALGIKPLIDFQL